MTDTPFTLRPIAKQAYVVAPEQSHPRLSLKRVLYVKFLRWVENSSASELLKAILNCSMFLLIFMAIMLPHFAIGILTAAWHWSASSRVLIFCATLLLSLNAKRLYRLARRHSVQRAKTGKAPTYHGIPFDELASYLFTSGGFTTDAMSSLALSQRKWRKIADELEHHGVLIRGESNARVLADITREELTRQLRDGFPLVFDPMSKTWVERRGSFDQWVLAKERKEQKDVERVEKLERKEDNIRDRIAKLQKEQTGFQSVMALMNA